MTEFYPSRRKLLLGAAAGGAILLSGGAGALVDRLAQGALDNDATIASLLSHEIPIRPEILMAVNRGILQGVPFEFKLPEKDDLIGLLLDKWIQDDFVKKYISISSDPAHPEIRNATFDFGSPSEEDTKDPFCTLSTVASVNLLIGIAIRKYQPFILKGYRGLTPLPRRITGDAADELANTMTYSLNKTRFEGVTTLVEQQGVMVPEYFMLDDKGESITGIKNDYPKTSILLLRDHPKNLLESTVFNAFVPVGTLTEHTVKPQRSTEINFKPKIIRP